MIPKIFISFCIAIMITVLSTMVSYADNNEKEIKKHTVLNVDSIYWFGDNNFTVVIVDKSNKHIYFTKLPPLTGNDSVDVVMDATDKLRFEYCTIYNKTTAVTYIKYIIHIRTLDDLRTGIRGMEQKSF